MTTITIYRDKNEDCIGFEMEGHAEFARAGKDIVCSAISILACNAYNSIETLTNDKFAYEEEERSGYMYFSLQENPSKEAKLLLNSMVLGLSLLEGQYGSYKKGLFTKKYLQLIFKEV